MACSFSSDGAFLITYSIHLEIVMNERHWNKKIRLTHCYCRGFCDSLGRGSSVGHSWPWRAD